MLERFLEQLERCTTVNLFNRLRISLELILAPAEIVLLAAQVRERRIELPEVAAHWLGRMETLIVGDGRPAEAYVRRTLADDASWYAAPGSPAERAERTVVIAFTGDAHRLMMPLALFLQNCPADRYEFLVLFDRARSLYLNGVAGLGDTLEATLERIASIAPRTHFRRAMSFGTSAGGLAAVWAAVALQFDRAVSVGGVTPAEVVSRVQTQGMSADGFAEVIRVNAGHLPEVLLVAGEDAQRDRMKARTMADYLPATQIFVPGCSEHNVLYDLWTQGELRPFLARLMEPGAVSKG